MERIDSSLENDIAVRTVDDRSSAIRRRRRDGAGIAIDVIDAPTARVEAVATTAPTTASEFINNYNPVDIAKLAAEVVNDQMGIKTEAKVEIKTAAKKIDDEINKDFIKITQLKQDWGETTVSAQVLNESTEIDDIAMETSVAGVRINMRGKLAIGVASVAMLMLLFFTFYNIAVISGLNKNIAAANAQIQIEQAMLEVREDAYAVIISDLKAIATSLGFKPIENGNTIFYSPADITTEGMETTQTNWFNEFVKWVQNLFT